MKNTFATVALFAISATACLSATTEAAKADAASCPANSCNKVQVQAQAPAATAKDAPKAKDATNPAESATAKVTPAPKA